MTPKCYSYIRFSTPEQLKGDSLRRQLKMSEEYAKEHGLELDSLQDQGVSAFKGKHRTHGALGAFLKLVREGAVPKGSVLLVESLDRLSREEMSEAAYQFLEIIRAGITIVTLSDKKKYDKDSINEGFGEFIISIAIISRAHEESETKSRRLKAAWEKKRNNLHNKKLTSICPAWLEINEEKTAFRPVKKRCEIIKKIFEMKLAGIGTESIARRLNEQSAKSDGFWMPSGRKGKGTGQIGWRKSYIMKILRNEAVIGHYQPHKIVVEDGKRRREPVGEVITNYFPAIISGELFYGVQDLLNRNKPHGYGSGRKGKVNNLFSHLAKCGYCGAPMQIISKGGSQKYLVCDNARRGLGCERIMVPYMEFEKTVLRCCRRLNLSDILQDSDELSFELKEIDEKITSSSVKLSTVNDRIENISDTISNTKLAGVRETLELKLHDLIQEKEQLIKSVSELNLRFNYLSDLRENTIANIKDIDGLYDLMKSQKNEELALTRLKVREKLRQIVAGIYIYPGGFGVMFDEEVIEEMFRELSSDIRNTEEVNYLNETMFGYDKKMASVELQFKRGAPLMLYPIKKGERSQGPYAIYKNYARELLQERRQSRPVNH